MERVEANGHVTITEGERIVTGEEAVFDQDARKITMTGDAVMREGANIIRGDRIVVFLDENRGVVESTENRTRDGHDLSREIIRRKNGEGAPFFRGHRVISSWEN